MKTYVLGLIALGLTNLMIAQNDIAAVTISDNAMYTESKPVNSVKKMNMEYLSLVNYDGVANKIKKIQRIVANYDIKTADVYQSKRNTTYTVNFKEGDNTVVAIYDKDGKIESCEEHYQAIRLPYKISSKIAKEYPGWAFKTVECDIIYTNGMASTITYKVVLNNGRKSKKIAIAI